MFVTKNTKENRIVCDAPENYTVYYSGSLDKSGSDFNMDYICITPSTKRPFCNLDEVSEYVKNVDPKKLQGIFVYNSSNNKTCKLVNTAYNNMFNARGNEPNIKFRYLQVRNDVNYKKCLYELYPNYIPDFEKHERDIFEIGDYLYNAYISRFVYKEFCSVPSEYYTIIRQCHGWHILDRANNKITLNKVLSVMDEQPGYVLNRMIKVYNETK
jgi:hypothetical protein